VIRKEQTLPEIIGAYPQARRIFDAYGLHGCGGALGPQETLEFFSAVHNVPLTKLLTELEAAVAEPAAPAAEVEYREELGDVLYKRFFAAAIAVMLTVGAGLGVLALAFAWTRGTLMSLDMMSLIQAHANAQVFGWLGLFVMGFAFQGLPRFKYVKLWRPELGNACLWLMAPGTLLRATGAIPAAWSPYVATAGAALQAVAVLLFAAVIVKTLTQSELRESWDSFVYAALASFVAVALFEPYATWRSLTARTDDVKIRFTADFMGPYRDLQLLGFGAMIVFGVGQRILPAAFGFRAPGARAVNDAFLGMVTGLLVDLTGWFWFRAMGDRAGALTSWAGLLLFLACALWLAWELRGFTGGAPGRSVKFIRSSFAWLAVGAALFALTPLFMRSGHSFPHGLYGAARHAIGVGFLSFMIVGVSVKVVPVLKGLDPAVEPALWTPYALLTAGLGLRIASQASVDLLPAGASARGLLTLTAASGPLTAAGFLVYGLYMGRLLFRSESPAPSPSAGTAFIHADVPVARIVERYPSTLDVFEAFGFGELRNPLLRNTIGRRTTVRLACSLKHVNLEKFLEALRKRAE
jgi:hypothetical protein